MPLALRQCSLKGGHGEDLHLILRMLLLLLLLLIIIAPFCGDNRPSCEYYLRFVWLDVGLLQPTK
jgi:hypothetical protein